MIKPSTMRILSALLVLGFVSAGLDGVLFAPSALSRTKSAVELRLRRSPGRVDVVIAGLGATVRAASQNQSDGRWSALLTGVDLGDRPFTPQQMVLPSSELLSVRLEPLDGDLQLIVKARMGERVPTPTISADGKLLLVSFAGLKGADARSTARLDLRRPGRVAQPVMAPPMRPRASAPPLGDIAVGSMLINNRSFVRASGPPVSLSLNKAPAKDALMSLARLGGYGFVFVGDSNTENGDLGDGSEYLVTMSFRNERYERALNSVLMASGLEGRLDDNMLLVGTAVSAQSFGPEMSKVFRMNQVDVDSASGYLRNLGASILPARTSPVKPIKQGDSSSSGELSVSSSTNPNTTETFGPGLGPLLGLEGTTDSRLNTITLVGDPKLIRVAESFLKQIDLRQRQVAVKVQILDVGFKNGLDYDSSFVARLGNSYFINDKGRAHMNFGLDGESSPLKNVVGFDEGFYSYLDAAINSTSAKIIAQPTILVLEGQKAKVEAATEVATSVVTEAEGDGDARTTKTEKSNAGLTLEVELSKVDDNGFITLSLIPEVSVPLPGGFVENVPIFNIKKRRLESGQIRLRDRQTLILTGIIEQDDTIEVQKWPVLGDLPLIGSMFRKSKRTREKRELVVLVTPSIVSEEAGAAYGYGYKSGTSAGREFVQKES